MLVKADRDNFWILNWMDEFMIGHKGFICGGCFKNVFNKEKIKDIDLFFQNESDFYDAVGYFDSMTPGYDKYDKREEEYTFYYENSNVKAYKHTRTGIVIELCCKIYGTAEQILQHFDFTIVKFAYYKEEVLDELPFPNEFPFDEEEESKTPSTHIEYKILMDNKFFEHLHMKRLVIDNKISYPMSTLERMFRYAKYGYYPCRETKMKIVKAIRELSEEKVKLSESLYEGVD